MPIVVHNNPAPPPKKEEPKKIGAINAANIQIKNKKPEEPKKEIPTNAKVEIKQNPSSGITAMKKDGTIVQKYPHHLYINDEKVDMNNKLHEMINNIIKEI